jgi:hypothetical protein
MDEDSSRHLCARRRPLLLLLLLLLMLHLHLPPNRLRQKQQQQKINHFVNQLIPSYVR